VDFSVLCLFTKPSVPDIRKHLLSQDFDDQPRRQTYRELIAKGTLSAGYASEDGVGLHYVGTQLHEAVTIRPAARAWWVEADDAGGYTDRAVVPRAL
jgi:hypothetical protein